MWAFFLGLVSVWVSYDEVFSPVSIDLSSSSILPSPISSISRDVLSVSLTVFGVVSPLPPERVGTWKGPSRFPNIDYLNFVLYIGTHSPIPSIYPSI